MPPTNSASAVRTSTFIAAICMRCSRRPSNPARSPSDKVSSDLEREGQVIRLVFENGTRRDADIVIGADGIRSKVRDILLGSEPPRFTGRVAQRAIFPTERLRGHTVRDCTKWWGPDRHLLAYFMTRRRDEVYLMGSVPAAAWESE